MFYYISGKLALLQPGFAVIDAGGVGYRLTISQNTYDSLPRSAADAHKEVKLYTYMAIREDDLELFGFASETELSSFKMLLTVSGVGPKAAISILSLLTPEKFALAVCTEDQKTISKASGIGPKTAARIILELKDKLLKSQGGDLPTLPSSQGASVPPKNEKLSEAVDALMVLGYSRAEALAAIKDMDLSKMELEEIIRLSLKKLMKY
jgi:Holliday junction DNA helicase RuvA